MIERPSGPLSAVVVVVDAANVVGSRPDGWWRDRRAAAARLVDRLAALPGAVVPEPFEDAQVLRVDVVLEGLARRGVPEGELRGVVVHHAPGSGDDVLAELCGPGALLVTADRALASRAAAAGARVVGPRRLLSWLDERT